MLALLLSDIMSALETTNAQIERLASKTSCVSSPWPNEPEAKSVSNSPEMPLPLYLEQARNTLRRIHDLNSTLRTLTNALEL